MDVTLGQNEPSVSQAPALIGRVKRLVAAVYRLTQYFSVEEPMRQSLRYRANVLLDTTILIKDIKDPLYGLLSYMDVLLVSGFLSETNYSILKDEILSLINEASSLGFGEQKVLLGALTLPKEEVLPRALNTVLATKETGPVTESLGQKAKRQGQILDFIKKSGGASVRDLLPIVRGCSEKTIQRELAILIARGDLRREGERRWSKYLAA